MIYERDGGFLHVIIRWKKAFIISREIFLYVGPPIYFCCFCFGSINTFLTVRAWKYERACAQNKSLTVSHKYSSALWNNPITDATNWNSNHVRPLRQKNYLIKKALWRQRERVIGKSWNYWFHQKKWNIIRRTFIVLKKAAAHKRLLPPSRNDNRMSRLITFHSVSMIFCQFSSELIRCRERKI